ncbi:MAG TPA: hypothetical protein VJ455_08140 [Ignavibacteria bacterium]|nr:hypothetical protein [Ignavibacteria bacterium]
MNKQKYILVFLIFTFLVYLSGCSSSKTNEEENTQTTEIEETEGGAIISAAQAEQENEMYSPKIDDTYLYWLDNQLIKLKGSTKCNIYALNVLYKSGYKTPTENTLTRDLVDTDKFTDILPVIGIQTTENAKKGDLIVWNGHVIIMESLTKIKNDLYAVAWWAGTRQKDNGDNIKNNVCYGKYKLNGYYVVRRPVKK